MKKLFLLILLITIVPFGCGKDEVQPSSDSLITLNAIEAVNSIKDAYQDRNTSMLRAKLNPELFDEISNKLGFATADLSFSRPRMVRIKAPDVSVLLNWQGNWEVDSRTLRDRGTSTLVFDIDSMKLVRIEGANPFIAPGQ